MNVLLVENEPDICRLISFVLEKQGFEVLAATDVHEADERLAEHPVDLILLDLMLPGEDGYSYCRRLKEQEATRGIPVIMVSARAMPHEIRKGMDCGAAGYITKPYNPLTLGDEIRRIYRESREGPRGEDSGAEKA